MIAFLNDQHKRLRSQINIQRSFMIGDKYKPNLVYLPLVGDLSTSNFESIMNDEILSQWPIHKEIKLEQINFKATQWLHGIQLKLTHGVRTPLYQTNLDLESEPESVNVDTSKRIGKVGVLARHYDNLIGGL